MELEFKQGSHIAFIVISLKIFLFWNSPQSLVIFFMTLICSKTKTIFVSWNVYIQDLADYLQFSFNCSSIFCISCKMGVWPRVLMRFMFKFYRPEYFISGVVVSNLLRMNNDVYFTILKSVLEIFPCHKPRHIMTLVEVPFSWL